MTNSIPSTESSFEAVAQLLARRVGHRLDATRQSRLSRAAAEEAARLGLAIHKYVAMLEAEPDVLQSLLNRVTVQETSFFRDAKQFAALASHILPGLPKPVTIWSAGCANGQEPYSVAMLLTELGDTTARVIATDVSTKALERARRGRYSAREIADLGPRQRFLAPVGDDFQIVPAVRSRVEFSVHNLFSEPPPFDPGTCPIVMCRNVLIYFGREEVVAFVDRVADWLPPGGWLFLGYSESLWQVTERFQLVRLGDAFVYQRREASTTPKPVAVAARRPPVTRVATARAVKVEARRLRAAFARCRSRSPRRRRPSTTPPRSSRAASSSTSSPTNPSRISISASRSRPSATRRLRRRVFTAGRAALDRCDAGVLASSLEGYGVEELSLLLDRKMVDRS